MEVVIKRFEIYQIVLDQIRTVDKARLVKRMGQLGKDTQEKVLAVLAEMFAE
jgi:mRNA interferase MazF